MGRKRNKLKLWQMRDQHEHSISGWEPEWVSDESWLNRFLFEKKKKLKIQAWDNCSTVKGLQIARAAFVTAVSVSEPKAAVTNCSLTRYSQITQFFRFSLTNSQRQVYSTDINLAGEWREMMLAFISHCERHPPQRSYTKCPPILTQSNEGTDFW